MGIQAFTPQGNTVTFLAATSAPTAVQPATKSPGPGLQLRIINSGTVTAFLGWGADAATAGNNAVVITTTNGNCVPLLAGTDEVLTFPPGSFFTGITASGNAAIYLTPGDGL